MSAGAADVKNLLTLSGCNLIII